MVILQISNTFIYIYTVGILSTFVLKIIKTEFPSNYKWCFGFFKVYLSLNLPLDLLSYCHNSFSECSYTLSFHFFWNQCTQTYMRISHLGIVF